MTVLRIALALVVASGGALAAPANAQFFLKGHSFASGVINGDEPTMGVPLPGATPEEVRAGLVWSMRAALNVAALQCQFEPTLLTVPNYNAVLKDHDAEFDGSMKVLTKYFTRTNKAKGAGQKALDQYGTRIYSSFVTVGGQFGFCDTAAEIGRDAVFTPRGQFGMLATQRMQELRNSLFGSWGEEGLTHWIPVGRTNTPRLDPICWDKKGNWVEKKCGAFTWPAPAAVATR